MKRKAAPFVNMVNRYHSIGLESRKTLRFTVEICLLSVRGKARGSTRALRIPSDTGLGSKLGLGVERTANNSPLQARSFM